jgi:hypothetical protein
MMWRTGWRRTDWRQCVLNGASTSRAPQKTPKATRHTNTNPDPSGITGQRWLVRCQCVGSVIYLRHFRSLPMSSFPSGPVLPASGPPWACRYGLPTLSYAEVNTALGSELRNRGSPWASTSARPTTFTPYSPSRRTGRKAAGSDGQGPSRRVLRGNATLGSALSRGGAGTGQSSLYPRKGRLRAAGEQWRVLESASRSGNPAHSRAR